MSRIRTIKPEFWTSDQISECSPNTRLLFIGIWNFCDDAGVHPASVSRLKMQIFPSDNFSKEDVRRMVDELLNNNLLIEYEIENQMYWQVTGWKHQKIDQPTYKFPLPNGNIPENPNRRRVFAEQSNSVHDGREGKGREGSGKERKGSKTVCAETKKKSSHAPSDPALVVMTFPVDGTHENFHVLKNDVEKWQKFYPLLDVQSELVKMTAWIDANPKRRKTREGMPRFVVNWLNREQDSGKSRGGASGQQRSGFENEVERTLRLIDEAEAAQK